MAGELSIVLGDADAHKAHWPLLAEGDTGDQVRAAQYLLRAAGHDVEPDGEFGSATTTAVRDFQVATGAEDTNGVLGGESWPVLVDTARPAENPDVARAVEILSAGSGAESVPGEPTAADWQSPRHRRRARRGAPRPAGTVNR